MRQENGMIQVYLRSLNNLNHFSISYPDLMKDFKLSMKKLLRHSKEDSKMQQQPYAF